MESNKNFDEHMADFKKVLPKSVVVPVELSGKDKLKFRCYPGIGCFTKCCHNIRIVLTPYDIYRLKTRLNMSYIDFLSRYTTPDMIDGSPLPVVALKMKNEDGRPCPFVTPEGCTVYSDRPVICRYYPIGMGTMKKYDKKEGEDFFILIKEDHCLGHQEEKVWTVNEWIKDQGTEPYQEMNRDWSEVVLKAKTLGQVQFSDRSLELFYIVSTNLDLFRDFFFTSGIAETYELEPAYLETLRENELELLKFSQKWLRFLLFGEGDLKVKKEIREKVSRKLEAAKIEAQAKILAGLDPKKK
ncbi:MAG: YkgJ family cysteine cluster protein [Thermodesulfovibrionales bacterium]